jgi:hypothetical protein
MGVSDYLVRLCERCEQRGERGVVGVREYTHLYKGSRGSGRVGFVSWHSASVLKNLLIE